MKRVKELLASKKRKPSPDSDDADAGEQPAPAKRARHSTSTEAAAPAAGAGSGAGAGGDDDDDDSSSDDDFGPALPAPKAPKKKKGACCRGVRGAGVGSGAHTVWVHRCSAGAREGFPG